MTEVPRHEPLQHIGIEREPDIAPERRRRPGQGPRLPQRNRNSHGDEIQSGLGMAVTSIEAARQTAGISPDRLIVVEFQSLDMGCRKVFEERFSASVVDERAVKQVSGSATDIDLTQILVQFPSREEVSRLNAEAVQYRRDTNRSTGLPPGLRKSFFDGLETIRAVTREERVGARLQTDGFPNAETFYIDVDLWHPGTQESAREVLNNLRQICAANQGRVAEDMRTSSLVLARIHGSRRLAEKLLDLDFVAQVNLPPVLPAVYGSLFDSIQPLQDHAQPIGNEPVVAVLDSGVLSGHGLLRGWIVDEVDFDSGENTVVDQHGHGTQVSGIIVYGDVTQCIESGVWVPEVLIANAKVLRKDPLNENRVIFPEEHRPEAIVEQAIRHFHETLGCRVFNLSLGNQADIYLGGRQFAWAEVLDNLARELNSVIVVSAGNNANPPMPNSVATREEFQAGVRDALLNDPAARLSNPATSAIAITVGSIARSASPRSPDAFAGAPKGAPAPFSRLGPGYEGKPTQRAVKPEFVAYGGNFALQAIAGGAPRWVTNDLHLGEPTTRLNTDGARSLTSVSATSFAAPHVSNAAAWAYRAVEDTMGVSDANLTRALLGVSSATPPCGDEWLLDPRREVTWDRLRMVGYGMLNVPRVRYSLANDACLMATDRLDQDHWHLYAVAVPPAFSTGRGKRGISVALAFDPPVRASRREYLSRTMWFEVLKGLTSSEILNFRTRYTGTGTAPSLTQSMLINMRPTKSDVQWSTLQVRHKEWNQSRNFPTANGATEPVIHILVGCQSRFPHGEGTDQRYGLAVRFWHSSSEVKIYQQLQTQIRSRARQVIRARVDRRV